MHIFNHSLFIGSSPSALKILNTLIFKTKLNSFQPISLSSLVSLCFISIFMKESSHSASLCLLLYLLSCLNLSHSKTKQQNKKICIKGTNKLLVAEANLFFSLKSFFAVTFSEKLSMTQQIRTRHSYFLQHPVLRTQNRSHCIVMICLQIIASVAHILSDFVLTTP